MFGRALPSLRARLLVILFFAILPALGLTLFTGFELRQRAISEGQDNALRNVQTVLATQALSVQRTHQLLKSLAGEAEVQGRDPVACGHLVAAELQQHLSYANLGVAGPDGTVFCSAAQLSGRVNVVEWAFFQHTLQSHGFVIGDYRSKGIGGQPTFNFGYPVLDAAGTVRSVVFAEIDLYQLNRTLITTILPLNSVFLVVDRNGVILDAFSAGKKWVGRELPQSAMGAMLASYRERTVKEAWSPDGVSRLYAFVPLDDRKEGSLTFAAVAIPTRIAYDIARTTTRNLVVLILLAIGVFATAWIGGNLLFLRPVNALVTTTRRLREGDLSARTGLGQGTGELAQLAIAFDDTAEKLQAREEEAARIREELRRYGDQLEQRVAERTAALDVARKEADHANQVKSEFLSRMSHELRTPLNAVIGFSEMLLERMVGDLTIKQEEFVRDIKESGTHLLTLVNDLLDISRIEAGRMELHLTEANLQEIVEGARVTLQPLIQRKRLVLSSTVDPQAAVIHADNVRVKQILFNLLSNAVKFTPDEGQIRIEVRRINDEVEMAVADTGPGISPEDQGKLFRPFAQLQTTQQTEYPGTGLGLVLVQRLAELHGGRVGLESEVGKGSRFIVRLPVSPKRELVSHSSTQDPQHRISKG